MDTCLFCKIAAHALPADIVYEDEHMLAFKDINPVAPVHILIIPRQHITDVSAVEPQQALIVGQMFVLAGVVAAQQGVADSGFRLVVNQGQHSGQSVFHLHMHLIGGRQMTWPPG